MFIILKPPSLCVLGGARGLHRAGNPALPGFSRAGRDGRLGVELRVVWVKGPLAGGWHTLRQDNTDSQ